MTSPSTSASRLPYDLDNLEPNDFFPIASAVVFAQARDIRKGSDKIKRHPLAPGRVEIWRGPTDTPQVTRNAEALHHDDGEVPFTLRRLRKARRRYL